MEGITLFDFIVTALGSGAMGYVVFYLWDKLESWLPWLASADMEMKRVCIAVVSFAIVQPAFWFGVLVTAVDAPSDWLAWLTATFYYASIAFVAATVKHGAAKASE